jgi:hypothetical protein
VKPTFKTFNPFNRFAEPVLSTAEGFNSPTSFLPRVAGKSLPRTRSGDEGGGLNDLNFLNELNSF